MGYKHCRETILDQGAELIRQKGYHHVGINEILKVCGVPKGSFYNFFSSKEDFVEQSLRNYGVRSAKMMEQFFLDEQRSPLERLKQFYRAIIDSYNEEGCTRGCLIANLSSEIGGTNTQLAKVADEVFQHNVSLVTACVLKAQEQEEITTQFSAPYLAEYLQAGLAGAFSRMKVQRNRQFLDQWYTMTFAFLETA